MNLSDAAALLGVPEHEVTDVADGDEGTVITTFDGVRYVVVPADQPDAVGNHGLMYLEAPSVAYGGQMPVYARAAAPAAEPVPVEEKEAREQTAGLEGTANDPAEHGNTVTAEEKKAAATHPRHGTKG